MSWLESLDGDGDRSGSDRRWCVRIRGLAAEAQDPKAAEEKGVKTSNLVTSLGGFRGTANVPVVLTGQIVEIEPGGQTGRQRFMAPSYMYMLEGTLTTDSEGGPIGVAGIQYHSAGQSYMDPVGIWHNHTNAGPRR